MHCFALGTKHGVLRLNDRVLQLLANRELAAGTRLVARYKKQERTCEVVETADGLRYRLDGGTEHRSPSSAGRPAMEGVACNGWRFWSVEGTEKPAREPKAKAEKPVKAKKEPAAKPTAHREFNRFIRLMNAVNIELASALFMIREQIAKLDLKHGWLRTVQLWGIETGVIGDYLNVALKEPLTASEYAPILAAARATFLPLTQCAEAATEEHPFRDEDYITGDGDEPLIPWPIRSRSSRGSA